MKIVLYTYIPLFLLITIVAIEIAKRIAKKYPTKKLIVFVSLTVILASIFTVIVLNNFPQYVGGLPPDLTVYLSILILSTYILYISIKSKQRRKIINIVWILLVINLLSTIWFIPFSVDYEGEMGVCKFRFQVFEYDIHDYGKSELLDVVFCYDRSKCGKYGGFEFYDKLGGWKEYFGFKPIDFEASKNKKYRFEELNEYLEKEKEKE